MYMDFDIRRRRPTINLQIAGYKTAGYRVDAAFKFDDLLLDDRRSRHCSAPNLLAHRSSTWE